MNQKGQGEEFIILIAIVIFAAGFFVSSVFFLSTGVSNNIAADNFCESWALEQEVTHISGTSQLVLGDGWHILCRYSKDAEIFDGGISEGQVKKKYFKISEEDLQEWTCK